MNSPGTESHPKASRLGLALFAIYLGCYAVFVAVAAFFTFSGGEPSGGLAAEAFGGLNWGVVGGMGLIAGAFLLALLYAFLRAASDAGRGGAA